MARRAPLPPEQPRCAYCNALLGGHHAADCPRHGPAITYEYPPALREEIDAVLAGEEPPAEFARRLDQAWRYAHRDTYAYAQEWRTVALYLLAHHLQGGEPLDMEVPL